jgi:hypothetical protein
MRGVGENARTPVDMVGCSTVADNQRVPGRAICVQMAERQIRIA